MEQSMVAQVCQQMVLIELSHSQPSSVSMTTVSRPNTMPLGDRPLDFDVWDDTMLWNDTADGFITNNPYRKSSYGVPQELDNVKILYGKCASFKR